MTELTYLDLSRNQISNIYSIRTLTNLSDLRLNNNNISDISALSGLSNLEILYLSANQVSDVSALSNLTNLITLDLEVNPLNYDAYNIFIPIIRDNNPVVELSYDPIPPEYGQEPVRPQRIFFVDDNANGENNGTSWAEAFNHLGIAKCGLGALAEAVSFFETALKEYINLIRAEKSVRVIGMLLFIWKRI